MHIKTICSGGHDLKGAPTGLSINQAGLDEIDYAAGIRSTFGSFIPSRRHLEFYIDQYGTRRCAACKHELGQGEVDDPREAADFAEQDEDPEPEDHEEDDDPRKTWIRRSY